MMKPYNFLMAIPVFFLIFLGVLVPGRKDAWLHAESVPCAATASGSIFSSRGASGILTLSGDCTGPWQVSSDVHWISFPASSLSGGIASGSKAYGSGNGTVAFQIAGNFSGAARSGHILFEKAGGSVFLPLIKSGSSSQSVFSAPAGGSVAPASIPAEKSAFLYNSVPVNQNATLSCGSCSIRFGDVPEDGTQAAVFAIACAGIIPGCSSGNFCGATAITHAQMAQYLVRAKEGEPPADYCAAGSPFGDLPAGDGYCKYARRLKELNITPGCTNGNFCPNADFTREQLAAYLVRAVYGEPPTDYCSSGAPFGDVAAGSTFCPYIKKLKELGGAPGCGGSNYCPAGKVTKSEAASFLYLSFLKGQCEGTVALIGSSGGKVSVDGATVTVPAGAFTSTMAVVLSRIRNLPGAQAKSLHPVELLAASEELSAGYLLSGLQKNFLKDILVEIPIPGIPSLEADEKLFVRLGIREGGRLKSTEKPVHLVTSLEGTISGNLLKALIKAYPVPSITRARPQIGEDESEAAMDFAAVRERTMETSHFVGYGTMSGSDMSASLNQMEQYYAALAADGFNWTINNCRMHNGVYTKIPVYFQDSGAGDEGQYVRGSITGWDPCAQNSAWRSDRIRINTNSSNTPLRVRMTMAHELFHMIQVVYAAGADDWIGDASSNALETVLTPTTCPDLVRAYPCFMLKGVFNADQTACLADPWYNIGRVSPGVRHGYGSAPLLEYFVKRSAASFHTIWNSLRTGSNTYTAVKNAAEPFWSCTNCMGTIWEEFIVKYFFNDPIFSCRDTPDGLISTLASSAGMAVSNFKTKAGDENAFPISQSIPAYPLSAYPYEIVLNPFSSSRKPLPVPIHAIGLLPSQKVFINRISGATLTPLPTLTSTASVTLIPDFNALSPAYLTFLFVDSSTPGAAARMSTAATNTVTLAIGGPWIESVSTVAGCNTLVLTGFFPKGSLQVFLDSVAATVVSRYESSELSVAVPQGVSGSVNLSVYVNGLKSNVMPFALTGTACPARADIDLATSAWNSMGVGPFVKYMYVATWNNTSGLTVVRVEDRPCTPPGSWAAPYSSTIYIHNVVGTVYWRTTVTGHSGSVTGPEEKAAEIPMNGTWDTIEMWDHPPPKAPGPTRPVASDPGMPARNDFSGLEAFLSLSHRPFYRSGNRR